MNAVQFNPFSPESQANPYPGYQELCETAPVYHSDLLDLWVLSRFEDVSFTLKDERFSADRRKSTNPLGAPLARMEAQIAFRTLLERRGKPKLAEGGPEWNANFILRGSKHLQIAFR